AAHPPNCEKERGAVMRTFDDLRQYLASALRRLELQAMHLSRSLAKVEAGGFTDALERLDQFEALTARFARLQDLLIGPFRTVAILELEDQVADRVPDLLNLMEKRLHHRVRHGVGEDAGAAQRDRTRVLGQRTGARWAVRGSCRTATRCCAFSKTWALMCATTVCSDGCRRA
ncbi:MAG: hypothetical protein ACREA0_29495, partial [bacterium]